MGRQTPTRFKITHKFCDEGLVLNHLGECEARRLTCSDIAMKFFENKSLKPCEVRVDNYTMYCSAKETLSECTEDISNQADICETYSNYLSQLSPQLVQLYFDLTTSFYQQVCEPAGPAP